MTFVRSPQDFWAGLLFVFFGCFALWFGRHYNVGTLMRMGPGYLPRVLCFMLIAIGAYLIGRGALVRGDSIEASMMRPQAFILIAIVAFGLMIERFGLAPAVLVTTVLAAMASVEMRWRETIILAIGVSVSAVVLFIYLLGQSMDIWRF